MQAVDRQQIRQVRHRQQQARGVREPHRSHRERQHRDPQLRCEREHDGCQEHRGRVEAEHDRGEAAEHDDQSEQSEGVTAAEFRGTGRSDVEHLCGVGEFGDHGDGDEEDQDRSDPLRRRDRFVPRKRAGSRCTAHPRRRRSATPVVRWTTSVSAHREPAPRMSFLTYGVGMPHRRVRLSVDGTVLRDGLRGYPHRTRCACRLPPEVLAAADRGRPRGVQPPQACLTRPTSPSSRSTRQVRWTSTRPCTSPASGKPGYRVRYAIADVAAFVTPGDPVDVEAHVRGETLYSPDLRTPLHPPSIGEAAASLLPDQIRPALRLDNRSRRRRPPGSRRREASTRAVGVRLNYTQAQQRSTRRRAKVLPTAPSRCLPKSVGYGRPSRSSAAPSAFACLNKRWTPTGPVFGCVTALRCRSRTGTRRSRCSPAWRPPASCSAPTSGSCARCRSRRRSDRIAAPRGPRPRRRMAETPDVPGVCARPRSGDGHWCGVDRAVDTVAARRGLHGLRRKSRRRSPITVRSPLRTHMRLHRCDGSSTGTWANCAWQFVRTSTSRLGFVKLYLHLLMSWLTRGTRRTRSNVRASTSSRRC